LLPKLAVAEAEDGGRSISGIVVDAQDTPIPNVEIFCDLNKLGDIPVGVAKSGEDGRFHALLPNPEKKEIDDREYPTDSLLAFLPGHSAAAEYVLFSGATQENVRLVLGPPSNFCVHVIQPDGKAVPDAMVTISVLGMMTNNKAVDNVMRGRCIRVSEVFQKKIAKMTDRDGIARFPEWNPHDVFAVDVVASNYGRQRFWSSWCHKDRPSVWNCTLSPLGTIRGRVVSNDGATTDGIMVRVTTMSEKVNYSSTNTSGCENVPFRSMEKTVLTDSSGYFEILEIGHGWVEIKLTEQINTSHQYPTKWPWPLTDVKQCAESKIKFEDDIPEMLVPLQKAVHLHGTIHKTDPEVQLKNIQIRCLDADPTQPFTIGVDAEGRYDCYVLPGYLMISPIIKVKNATIQFLHPVDVDVPSEKAEYTIPPVEIESAHGRVVDEDGKPLSKICLMAASVIKGNYVLHVALTDNTGRFHLFLDRHRTFYVALVSKEYESHVIDSWESPPIGNIPDIILKPLDKNKTTERSDVCQKIAHIMVNSERYDETYETAEILGGIGMNIHSSRHQLGNNDRKDQ
jgi:hypothetical protein